MLESLGMKTLIIILLLSELTNTKLTGSSNCAQLEFYASVTRDGGVVIGNEERLESEHNIYTSSHNNSWLSWLQ